MPTGNPFGLLTSPFSVESAVIETLETWATSYAAEVERKYGLANKTIGRPPDPQSVKGGLDWQSVKADWMPQLVVIANPTGEVERTANVFFQGYHVEVGAIIHSEEGTDPEGTARRNAGLWAAACMGIIAQHGKLGTLEAVDTILTGAPRVEFFDSEDRRFAVGITTYTVYVQLMQPNLGPLVVQKEPELPYAEFPESTSEHITVKATPVTEPLK